MWGYDDPDLSRLQQRLDDADRGIAGMERDLDRRIDEIQELKRELTEERLDRIRLEGEVQALQDQVRSLLATARGTQGHSLEPICIGCQKSPSEISEYAPEVTGSDLSPDDYVRQEEGTYNSVNGHFLCTFCYIRQGMPTAPGGWIAP
jgi:hypothetical protein